VMSAELLPTRVRSIGMGLGVLGNAGVSAAFTFLFLPIVGYFGYAAMWGVWGVCTLAYFLFAAFVLPETRGKTLEEIEAHFAGNDKMGQH
jgi:tellurite resistance protein TehA-like permease